MKLLILTLTIVLSTACQKKSQQALSANTPRPQGGETTEGGGGTQQLESFLVKNNDYLKSSFEHGNNTHPNDFASQYEDKIPNETLLKFYNVSDMITATQKELKFRQQAQENITRLLSREDIPHKELLRKALELTTSSQVTFIWHLFLFDRYKNPAWALNNRSKLSIRMNSELFLGPKGHNERIELCSNILIPYYKLSPFDCYEEVDSIISTHEFLSLVDLEYDHNFRLSVLSI